jgi:hypothetical protein
LNHILHSSDGEDIVGMGMSCLWRRRDDFNLVDDNFDAKGSI